ncbi:hypothetical protein [Phytohabitans houttuyneae]|uniref:Uncharacterized protein n=1 Tax=Phytohabitans houttuyneae TaxID=1076126 RepID=A0A6V8K8W3_9ACTN|nr:hypothetical protein [Phytohabitans houttuyneae]GFJ79920.1 hypothetical protein Phou_041000 [Phytohabitans houttuyneae]
MDYRDWGYDSRGPRERRSADDAHPQSWDYTGEISGLERPSGARRGGEGDYTSYSSSSSAYSSGSIYRGRRRQQDDAVADDRPFGRRSARTRWQQGEEDATGTFSRYEEPDDRGGRHAGGWTPEIAPTSGWTPPAAPTSGWVGAASQSEWTREAYTGEWNRGDFTGEWHRDTGEPLTPSRSDSARRDEPGGGGRRRRAAPDWRELPALPSGQDDRRPAVPPQRDSFTDTSEWTPQRGEPAGGGQASRPRRPDWAVGMDPSSATGRRRRSWQDQTEARWPSTRPESDRADEPSGSWSSSAPVSGVADTSRWSSSAPVSGVADTSRWSSSAPVSGVADSSRWSGRAEVSRSDEPAARWSGARDARLSEDDPRWVGIPSSAPRSPAVAFPDEPEFDYDDRPAARATPTTYRDDDLRGAGMPPAQRRGDAGSSTVYRDDTPTAYQARAIEAPTEWRAPTAAPGSERGPAAASARAAAPTDWRAPTTVPAIERGRAQVSGRGAAPAADWRPPAADAGRERGLGSAIRRVATPDELEDQFNRAPGGVFAAVVATLAWYAVPLLLFAVYTVVQGEESQVLGSLAGGLTRFGAALAVSLVVAVLLRWVSNTWRSISVGLAAAVVGGGLSTVLLSALSGQPLGG